MKPILKPQYRTAVLYRDRLVYDIDFESWKIARMCVDDKTVQAETSTDEEADMFLERKFDTALGLIRGDLQFCLDYRTAAGDTANDKLKYQTDGDVELQPVDDEEDEITAQPETEEQTQQWPTHYTIGFRFSPYWYGNIETIKTCIHQYIVCYTLSEWFSLVKPDEAAAYLQKAEDYKKKAVNYCRQENAYGVTFRL
jgi:hypothetical protein